jgi:hypothetical protein
MFLTLADARASSIINVSQNCGTGDSFRQLINEATERLMIRGDWDGTVVVTHLCVRRGCVVFPRYVQEIRKMKVCGAYTPIENLWYEFLPQTHPWCNGWNSGNGDWGWRPWSWWSGRMDAKGRSPVFQDILGPGRTVRAYVQTNNDIGKTSTIFGTDNSGQPLMHKDENGNWQDGSVIVFNKPFGSTDTFVGHIDRILKDETEKPITMFGYDATNDVLETLVTLEPTETNPSFARYQLHSGTCNCNCDQSIVALTKLKFIPVKAETDPILVANIAALKLMVQCIKAEEANDDALARSKEAAAIREANLGLWSRDQEDQIAVDVLPFGRTMVGTQRLF